jgi:hypothetical protein
MEMIVDNPVLTVSGTSWFCSFSASSQIAANALDIFSVLSINLSPYLWRDKLQNTGVWQPHMYMCGRVAERAGGCVTNPVSALPSFGKQALNLAAHILAAAHGRLDLSMTIGAFGNLDDGPVIEFQAGVNQGRIAFCASCVHTHAAFFTRVSRHQVLLLVILLVS